MMLRNKLPWLAAFLHIVIFVLFLIYMHVIVSDGQSRLLWIFWIPLDFPVSRIVYDLFFEYLNDLDNGLGFYFPYFVHGILGPIWWYFVVRFLVFLFSQIAAK